MVLNLPTAHTVQRRISLISFKPGKANASSATYSAGAHIKIWMLLVPDSWRSAIIHSKANIPTPVRHVTTYVRRIFRVPRLPTLINSNSKFQRAPICWASHSNPKAQLSTVFSPCYYRGKREKSPVKCAKTWIPRSMCITRCILCSTYSASPTHDCLIYLSSLHLHNQVYYNEAIYYYH